MCVFACAGGVLLEVVLNVCTFLFVMYGTSNVSCLAF